MRRLHFVSLAVAFLALAVWPQPAEGGIVVIVMRETNPTLHMQGEQEEPEEATTDEATPEETAGQAAGRKSKLPRTRTGSWDADSVWSLPSPDREMEAETQPALDQADGVQAWVEFEEEPGVAPVGCGGAQAARGPAGFLPLALATAALLLARRRRHA